MVTAVERSVRITAEVEIAFAEQGDRDGIPLVFVHGYADSWRSFEGVLGQLPPSIHAWAISLRGHGSSSKPANGYDCDTLAQDVRMFMEAVGLRAAVLVGGSSGGVIVRRLAIQYPDCALGLALLGTPFSLRENILARKLLEEMISEFPDSVPTDFIRGFQQGTLAQPVPLDFLERMVSESAKASARVWIATLSSLLDDCTDEQLGEIRVPTLAVWGDRDTTVSREDQVRLTGAVPNSTLIVYDGAGHSLYWEEPTRIASDLVRFASNLR